MTYRSEVRSNPSSAIDRLMNWAQSRSLWYWTMSGGCCSDEVLNSLGCRYDLERFGATQQADPRQSDLLFVAGTVTLKLAPYLRELYDQMLFPRYVIALGSCANCGGAFSGDRSYTVVPGVSNIIPVDVYVPGCPPRPEAIMNGLIALQEKISG